MMSFVIKYTILVSTLISHTRQYNLFDTSPVNITSPKGGSGIPGSGCTIDNSTILSNTPAYTFELPVIILP